MDWLYAKWEQVKQDPFWGIVILGFLLVGTTGKFLGWMTYIKNVLAFLLSRGVTFDSATRKTIVSDTYAWMAVLVVAALVVLALFGLRIHHDRNRLRTNLKEIESESLRDKATVEKTFEKMMGAASKICAQVFPRDGLPQKNILSARAVFLVDDNFTATVSSEWEYKALTDLYFEQFDIGAETDADPCKYLDDIKFRVKDANPINSIAYLPSENSPHSKKVVVFFLPHMKPGEPIPRKICLNYRWPGMMRRLKNKGSEVGTWKLLSREPVPFAEQFVYFAPGIKDRIRASIHGARIGKPDDEECERANCDIVGYEDWAGWRYTLRNAPSGVYKLEFTYKA